MKKNLVSSLVLSALTIAVIIPSGSAAQPTFADMRQQAVALLEKAKAANPNPKYWADKTVAKAKRMWSCFTGSSQCSKGEIISARAWVAGTSAAIITALLIAGGIMINKNKVEQIKSGAKVIPSTEIVMEQVATDELLGDAIVPENAVQILAGLIDQKVTDLSKISDYRDLNSAKKDDIRGLFGKLFPQIREEYVGFYKDSGDIKGELFNKAIMYLKKQ